MGGAVCMMCVYIYIYIYYVRMCPAEFDISISVYVDVRLQHFTVHISGRENLSCLVLRKHFVAVSH